ncbi:hypothetical protein VP1G_11491 [Cytospora mali]|uniref:Uncharacterized protein n=1 Tax=Cytospora mali TaxID=578113 RepID=A0A194VFR2_CYTMA|nr:hypothetical protein VP1G_11491 [Valsa mali var. pyri (nom. inval.)]
MTGRGETAPREPTDSQEATTHRQSSRPSPNHPLSLSDLAHVDIERKTTRADVTQIELLGRDGIDSFYVTPWTTHDEDPTAFKDVMLLSESVEAQARSFRYVS